MMVVVQQLVTAWIRFLDIDQPALPQHTVEMRQSLGSEERSKLSVSQQVL